MSIYINLQIPLDIRICVCFCMKPILGCILCIFENVYIEKNQEMKFNLQIKTDIFRYLHKIKADIGLK